MTAKLDATLEILKKSNFCATHLAVLEAENPPVGGGYVAFFGPIGNVLNCRQGGEGGRHLHMTALLYITNIVGI